MRSLRQTICSITFASVALLAAPAAAFPDEQAVQATMLRASDLLLNLDLNAATSECNRLLALPEGEAAGRFCLSLVTLTRAQDTDDPKAELDRFTEQSAQALAAAEAQARAKPTDAETKLLLGLIHGGRALVDGGRKNYLTAIRDVREAERQFRDAQKLDPSLTDAAYGLGLYHLGLSQLPLLVRPIAALVLPSGDAALGLRELEQVAEHGVFLKMTARIVLLQFYAGPEQRYADALRLGRDLLRRYPDNPDLYFATANAASETGRFEDALEIGRQVGRKVAEGRPRFAELAARFNQLMGKIYMDQKDYASALTFFQRALEAPTAPRHRWVTAWAWTRSGMIYDLRGDRQEAVRRYQSALAVDTGGLAKELARQYLDAPYRGRS